MSPVGPPVPSSRDRWPEIEALFLAAREREPAMRAAFLEQVCGTDTALRQEVESLLAADQGATGFLESLTYALPATPDLTSQLRVALAGRYVVESEIARGGMAIVYLAGDVTHHRRVALKVLHPDLTAHLGAERFLREIQLTAKLHHPHILPLHDSGEADGLLYYVMPFVAGGSLRERLREELQLPVEAAVMIARQVADALDYAHRHGIIHRDIKPENILLTEDAALVADFGIARALDAVGGEQLTATGLAVGTPTYMSPEQAAGSRRLDGRIDVYALGCVLYEMLAGQPPFAGPTPQAIVARHAVDPVPALRTVRATVPRALECVVTQALAKVPADRFPTAGAFAEALSAAPSAVAVTEDKTSTSSLKLRGHIRRRRWMIAALTLIGVAAAAGLAALFSPKTAELEQARVLVVPFQNRTGDSTLDPLSDAAADDISRGLGAVHDVSEVLDARSLRPPGGARRLDAAGARALARTARAGSIVLGAYDRAPGDSLQFQAEVLDTRSGKSLRIITPLNVPGNAPAPALDGVRARVVVAMTTVLSPDYWGNMSQPSTPEAITEYTAGIGAWNNCGGMPPCRDRAVEHWRQAVAIDSGFTFPLAMAAYKLWQVGDCSRVDSIATALRPRLDRLMPEDRTHLVVATSLCGGGQSAALHAVNDGLNDSPGSMRLLDMKELVLLNSNRPHDAISVPDPHDIDHAPTLLAGYHILGMYDRALDLIARYRREKEDQAHDELRITFAREEVASLAALGRVADIPKMLDQAVQRFGSDRQGLRVMGLLEFAGQELIAHGHPAEAKQVFERAIAWMKAQPADQQATPDSRHGLADVLSSAGRWEEARALYQELAAADSSDGDVQAALGDLAARRGDRVEAARVDRWLVARSHPGVNGAAVEAWSDYTRARIAGLLGDRMHAIGLLRAAAQQGFGDWRWAHLDPDLAPLRADPDFQEWIRPKD